MAEILNINGVQIEQISGRRSSIGGISGTFRYNGHEFTLRYVSEKEFDRVVAAMARDFDAEDRAAARASRSATRSYTKTAGRRYGRPRGSDEYRKQLAAIFGKAELAGAATAVAANAKITEQVVTDMLGRVYITRGKYNIYSGNLDRAYLATLVQGRNIIGQYRIKNPPKGNDFKFEEGQRSRRMRVRLFDERHKLGNKSRRKGGNRKYGRERYRYKSWFERNNGYYGTGITAGRNTVRGFGYLSGGNNRVQSGIVIENMAPYAGAVQAKGYRVLPFGLERSYMGRASAKQKQLITTIPKQMLKAAGLI